MIHPHSHLGRNVPVRIVLGVLPLLTRSHSELLLLLLLMLLLLLLV